MKDILPGWNKAVKKFVKKASLIDLNDVKGSMKGLSNRAVRYFPFHYVAVKGHVRLMKLLFYTDLNINKRDVREWHWEDTPFIKACQYGQTEVVNLMVTSSKEFTLVSRINVQSLINVHSGISSNDSRRACLKMFPNKRA